MEGGHRTFGSTSLLVAVLVAAAASPADGLFLDGERHFKLTGSVYSQARFRMQESDAPRDLEGGGTVPDADVGDWIQWRNVAAPVLEGNLARALSFRLLDDFSFRLAGRLVYDGVYDFGAPQYRRALRAHLVSARSPSPNVLDPNRGPGLGGAEPVAIYRGTKPVERNDGGLGPCGSVPPFFDPICEVANPAMREARLRDQKVFEPRDLFAQQAELWEAYLNVEKRPIFLRIGRQNLAWGESDGQRLLDGINPLDRLFGLPFDEDLDEQRIPLWMVRANLQLVDVWGPLASLGLEGFLVPGVIDTTVGPTPFGTDYPYAPPAGCDPQLIANERGRAETLGTRPLEGCTRTEGGLLPRGTIKTSIYERLLRKTMENSRWGVRLLGILFRDYTLSVGAYRSFADVPQPRLHYTDLLRVPLEGIDLVPPIPTATIVEITHGTVTVVGGTLSFFQPHVVPGVLRAEMGYFMDEPAFVPIANLGNVPGLPDFFAGEGIRTETFVPTADHLRWVLGYDMFHFNAPWLSDTNLVVIAQWFHSLNLSGDGPHRRLARELGVDEELGRFDAGVTMPDGSRIAAPKYQSLGNLTVQWFMFHGRVTPQITMVGDLEGAGAALPNVTWRVTDALLVKVGYSAVFGAFFNGGFFRDRDQVGVRVTLQLS
jgi:hypothetical protein